MPWKFLPAALGLVVFLASCARQPEPSAINTDGSIARSDQDQKLPFDRPPAPRNVLMPSTALVPVPHNLPVGTLLAIRLSSPVSSATSRSGDTFSAVLDQPIIVNGEIVVAIGTAVTGRVVTARASEVSQRAGFLRLALASLTIEGKPIPLQSSSVFVKGPSRVGKPVDAVAAGKSKTSAPLAIKTAAAARTETGAGSDSRDVEFPPQRKLTFRLTKALTL